MKINGNQIRPGNAIEHAGGLSATSKTRAVKPCKDAGCNPVELTASSSCQPAVPETGVCVMVPPFVSPGESIVVDTREFACGPRAE